MIYELFEDISFVVQFELQFPILETEKNLAFNPIQIFLAMGEFFKIL